MATVIPPTSNVEAAYEDMFKEITRKLYGEETGNGLHTLGTPVAQVATTGPTAAPEGEQRSFTNLQIDRSTQPTIEYEHNNPNNATATSVAAASAAAATAAVIAAATTQNTTNVVIQQQPEGSVVVTTTTNAGGNFKSEDHLSTAFGLAALMQQNGFATTTGTILSTQAINKVITTAAGSQQQQQQLQQQQQQNVTGDQQQAWSNEGSQQQDQQQQQQQQQQPAPTTQIVQWTTTPSGKLQSYSTTTAQPQQQQQQQQQTQQLTTPKSKTNKNRNDHTSPPNNNTTEVIYTSPSTSGNMTQQQQQQTPPNANTSTSSNTSSSGGSSSSNSSRKKSQNNQNNNNNSGQPLVQKRYACTHCPYSTDRRDLYTRHENIHKDEKPFQCYACLKQFNRADHVKKHFLRMHREMQYDINKTRRHVPSSSSNGGGHHHGGGRSNITITTVNTSSTTSATAINSNLLNDANTIEQKPIIFQTQANVNLEQAFLEQQRQPTSSSLSIAETIEAVATATDAPLPQMKQEKNDDGTLVSGQTANIKPKREKRFTCCYCPWSGADKWGLKRHLNTHTKPFVCLLCDYKAARSERLATHVLKVHNKRACNKCSYLGDTLEEYQQHLNEVHPTAPSNRSNSNNNSTNNTNNTTTTTTNNNSSNNLNVLRTIGNTLGNNSNQLNQFQNNNNFSVNNVSTTTTNGNSVTIYTTTTTDNQGGNITTGGPLQEIIVNPSSMVGWRLSANGSLIPPHDLLTGGLPNAAAQKRGSERLFQYLEADGSDPEDYARLLKMDAISRNTASVAQDFHKAGGVHELKLPANHQLLFNNKLPSQWTTKEAAALLQSLSNANNLSFVYQQQQQQLQQRSKYAPTNGFLIQNENADQRQRHNSLGDDENSPSSGSSSSTTSSSDDMSPIKMERSKAYNLALNNNEQRKAMSKSYLHKNYDLQEASSNSSSTNANDIFMNAANNNNNINNYNKDIMKNQEIFNEDQENQEQLIRSSPAYKYNSQYYNNNNNNNNTNLNKNNNKSSAKNNNNNNNNNINNNNNYQHRLDLQHNKENNNNATFLTQMEFQNLNKIGTQFQNYVKDIISKYYAAETPVMYPNMPTATTTAQQSQQRTTLQTSPKRKRILSETEEYIEYLKNKEDITLTITPKNNQNSGSNGLVQKLSPPLKRERDLASDSYKKMSPKKQMLAAATAGIIGAPTAPQPAAALTQIKSSKKSISQLATLLPLLADAASQQQYLTAPLDFSKKAAGSQTETFKNKTETEEEDLKVITIKQEPEDFTLKQQEPQDPIETQTAHKAYANFSVNALLNNIGSQADKRSSRKQAQPKKIRVPPEMVIAMLRDKYLNRMVDHKLSCKDCINSKRSSMLVFNYHTKASLCLHRLWKHSEKPQKCLNCGEKFKQKYNLKMHQLKVHRKMEK